MQMSHLLYQEAQYRQLNYTLVLVCGLNLSEKYIAIPQLQKQKS
jgi:hypothetical protein